MGFGGLGGNGFLLSPKRHHQSSSIPVHLHQSHPIHSSSSYTHHHRSLPLQTRSSFHFSSISALSQTSSTLSNSPNHLITFITTSNGNSFHRIPSHSPSSY
eukprot:TRINITY_DN1703_c1_g2_i1.p2 TRINITY_DN1703_c1_g2~~TRINITY_DN1703_c1_g2_i1.p2  ORF type:complete len:101 (+),score=14.93 TRINITY_DN1703_c1_g2_i1:80-382(+)